MLTTFRYGSPERQAILEGEGFIVDFFLSSMKKGDFLHFFYFCKDNFIEFFFFIYKNSYNFFSQDFQDNFKSIEKFLMKKKNTWIK